MYRKNSYYSVKRYKHCPVPGGPEEPEVGYEVDRDEKEIVLSWPHPFTWEDYPITGYDIVCRETESEKIIHDMTLNDTDILNEPVVSHTVDLPPHIPDCYTLQCTVTASNALDQSNISITDIFFPKSKLLFCSVNATGFHCVHSFCVFLLFKRVAIIQHSTVQASPAPAIELVKTLPLGGGKQEIVVCVKVGLPFSYYLSCFAIIH